MTSSPPSHMSEEDERQENVFDQLKSIRAFTLDQLYLLHPDVGRPSVITATLPGSQQSANNIDVTLESYHDQTLYQYLVEYEQLRYKLIELKTSVKRWHRKTVDNCEQVWVLEEDSVRKIGMCQQDKIAEATLKYKRAKLSKKELHSLDLSFSELIETIKRDYIYYSFESQVKRNRIVTQLSLSYKTPDLEIRRERLRSSITTLIDFLKHLGDSKSDFVVQCRKWLRGLMKRHLEQATNDDYRFIIAQICKGPAGTADWCSDLIECKPYEQVSELFDSTPQYLTHCSDLLTELFTRLKSKIRRVTFNSEPSTPTSSGSNQSDQNWSLVDPRFNCSEELNLASVPNSNTLSELDVIKLCLRIPITQIFRAYVKKCLKSEEFIETGKNYEFVMLKLLTIGTIIIKTYQVGLETFNSIQYGNLIEYLSSQIRRTVIILSDQWTEFKRRLKGLDNALLMRLQVEYDNFILRSILIILELRQCGIWKHLSKIDQDEVKVDESFNSWSTDSLRPALAKLLQVTGLVSSPSGLTILPETPQEPSPKLCTSTSPTSLTYEFSVEWFREVSEPMLWHILWQFYHSGFVSSCDYHSDNYWLEKFQEKSVIYLFVNKIRDSSTSECSYLLRSITSMLLSRTRHDSGLVKFIATELFNLSFKHPTLKDKTIKRGVKSLIRCAEKFPNLISLYLSYMYGEDVEPEAVDLMKGCSLNGWICDYDEFLMMANWLIEYPLDSTHNKIARLIISKLLMNSPRSKEMEEGSSSSASSSHDDKGRENGQSSRKTLTYDHCFVNLKLRRQFALLLHEASIKHLPESTEISAQSLGAFVEVALGDLFCDKNSTGQTNLLSYAVDESFQQFYVWIWRIVFSLELHFLNQKETDWNDVRARSGTSRSINNTVLHNDSFHPVPSLQDSECYLLSEGVKNNNALASYIYLTLTDVTWHPDTLKSCVAQLNLMATSGHLTPSLMAMEYFTICHLNDLNNSVAKDQQCFEYFKTIITSNYDSTRLASLIVTQLSSLKQYRQLQLSEFYITVFLEVANTIIRQNSASWFTSDELNLDKIGSLLNHLVKFNFTTQRVEITRRFYDCSFSNQAGHANNSWLGSFFATNNLGNKSTKRDYLTTLHALVQKFKKYTWLRWVTTECDTLRLEKIWEDIVVYLSCNEDANLESAIKKVCPQVNITLLKSILPIYSWIGQIFDIVETDLNHPLCPLIWYNFFLNYFANSLNGVSVGLKLVSQETLNRLSARLDSLINYHLYKHRNWTSASPVQQNSLTQLYRAYRLWLQDRSLQDAYVDVERLRGEYLVPLLKAVIESSTEGACIQYIDLQAIETQNRNLCQIWSAATHLAHQHLSDEMIFVENNQDDSIQIIAYGQDEVNDAASLIVKPNDFGSENNKALTDAEDELKSAIHTSETNENYETLDEAVGLVKRNFQTVFDESNSFTSDIGELEKMRSEIVELIKQVYANKMREHIRVATCVDGQSCIGPAKIKFEVEEAIKDERTNECISDRQGQCEELIEEILLMPTNRSVQSAVFIEEKVQKMILNPGRAKSVVEILLKWINEPSVYQQLNGSYYVANHLFKTLLELLSTTTEVDIYNRCLMDVCCSHPGSVQIFSPHLSPSTCSVECFLSIYKTVTSKQSELGPIALFVLLSKFDLNSWLKTIKSKDLHHDIIITTSLALKGMGKQPDDSYNLTFELFRRHIHIQLALPDRRKFEEIHLLLKQFLTIMDEQELCPALWVDFIEILGLEKRTSLNESTFNNQNKIRPNLNKSLPSNTTSRYSRPSLSDVSANESLIYQDGLAEVHDSSVSNIFKDIIKLADSQMYLNYHSLNELVITIINFFQDKFSSNPHLILLERYKDYLDKFSVVLTTICFMWIRLITENFTDSLDLTWKQFSNFWHPWIYISGNCQNVGKNCYSLMSAQYVASIRYLISKMSHNTQAILQMLLNDLTSYVKTTKEVVYLELTILQRCLKNLPWNHLALSPNDIDNLATLSEQENYNISDLVSHVILQVNLKESLSKIQQLQSDDQVVRHSIERLSCIIALQSAHLKSLRLPGSYFIYIQVEKIEHIACLILARMEYANLEHSQTNKLLVNLMRSICIKHDQSLDDLGTKQGLLSVDTFNRSLIYAQFVSTYLVELIKTHPSVVKYHKTYLRAVMDNSLQDLKILVSPDVDIDKKTAIYENLLECCSSRFIEEESCLLLAKSLIRSQLLKDRPIVIMEVFHSVGQILGNARILVYTIENLIYLYLSMNGHYEKVWKSFSLKVLPSDLYLGACVDENACLALLVYFEFLNHNGLEQMEIMTTSATSIALSSDSNKIWSSFFHWITQLSTNVVTSAAAQETTTKSHQETCLVVSWMRLLDMLEPNLHHFVHHGRFYGVTLGVDVGANLDKDEKEDLGETANQSEAKQVNEPQQVFALAPGHRALLEFIQKMIAIYDSSNSTSFWSYLRLSRADQAMNRISLIALAVASFLANRTLTCLGQPEERFDRDQRDQVSEDLEQQHPTALKRPQLPAHLSVLRDECEKLKKSCMSRLDGARRSKSYSDRLQFIETLIESASRNDKVQYSEGVQLITAHVKALYSSDVTSGSDDGDGTKVECNQATACIMKILPHFNE